MADNGISAIQNASTPQQVATAYSAYSQSMTSAGQTPKPLEDIVGK